MASSPDRARPFEPKGKGPETPEAARTPSSMAAYDYGDDLGGCRTMFLAGVLTLIGTALFVAWWLS